MFNNNGGQGFQDPYAYYGTEHHARQLQREMGEQAERMRRQGNDLASWQNHCAVLEDALAQWQESHARQAAKIRELEADWAELRRNADEAVASWKEGYNRLKTENAALQAEARGLPSKTPPPQPAGTDEVQATLTALQTMNAQLQAQVASLETDHQMDDAERAHHLAEHERTSIFIGAVTGTLSELIAEPGVVRDQVQAAFRKHYALHLEMAMDLGLIDRGLPSDPLFFERFPMTASLINCLLDQQAPPTLAMASGTSEDHEEQPGHDEQDEDYMP